MWDPLPQLLDSAEPAARWIAHAVLLDKPAQDPDVAQSHTDVLADPATEDLLARLPDWEVENAISGHDKPQFAPHLLNLLADMGVTAADDDWIVAVVDAMLRHRATDGRFQSLQRWRKTDGALSASLPCDHHAITEVLVRAGRADHPAVRRGLHRMLADLTETPPGPAWTCVPDPQVGFRGPGRKGDICPQVTLQALRAFSGVPDLATSPEVVAAARTSLAVWRARASSKPYMFGHAGPSVVASGRRRGTPPSPSSTRSAATRRRGPAPMRRTTTATRWLKSPRAWLPTPSRLTAPSSRGRRTGASRATPSARRSTRLTSPPRSPRSRSIGSVRSGR